MTTHLSLQRPLLPTAQVSALTTGSITLPSARGVFAETSYQSLQTITVGASPVSNVEFTSIPQTYTHLEIRYWAYTDRTSNYLDDIAILFGNGSIDTGSNYSYHSAYWDNAAVSADYSATATYFKSHICIGSSQAATYKNGAGIYTILDYANSNKYKTCTLLAGCDFNGSGRTGFASGNWRSNSAITNIRIQCLNSNLAQYSKFALYGIMGS